MNHLFKLFLMLITVQFATGQNVERPPVWGIAKMTYLVSDFQVARDYYGDFLGFDEAFSYSSDKGKIISFKVNDRQYLEFIEDKDAKNKGRLVSVSFETSHMEQMRKFLQQSGIEVPDAVVTDGAGNEVILVHDNSGVPVEFIDFTPNSLHRNSKGKFLSENRISKRIHHAGLYCIEADDNDSFYVQVLGFRELWRFPENREEKVVMNYLQIPDCVENIEHYTGRDINFSHPCFLVDDMQETIYTLKERQGDNKISRPSVGRGKRWLLNLTNSDGTRVEFTEAHTIK
jgi:catechol 2,3-dioxygenase-like lactoylglutathione lyase family enzyme